MGLPQTRRSLRGEIKRVAEVLRDEGVSGLWSKLVDRANVYRRIIIIERPLTEPVPNVMPALPVVFDLLSKAGVADYIQFRPEADPSEISRRLDRGHWCFLVRFNGRIVHACWAAACPAWIEYLSHRIGARGGDTYLYDALTLPSFRGKKLAPATHAEMMRYFARAGFQRTLAVILPRNEAAFRYVKKVGWRRNGAVGYIKLGRWRHDFGWTTRHVNTSRVISQKRPRIQQSIQEPASSETIQLCLPEGIGGIESVVVTSTI